MLDLLLALTILAQSSHPRLYKTSDDVARARLNVQRFEWARDYFNGVRKNADKWAAKPEAELRAMVPPPGSIFAYGFSGCPVCGANWPWWGAGGTASFDNPRSVICPSCKRRFPDSDHPDSGSGWRSPKDGKTYYFVGEYNSFAVQQITLNVLRDLSIAYAVTADRRYSRAAAALFDSLADTYEKSTEGSVDYPSKNNYGRLERPQYQVARVLVLLADDLDLLYDSPDFAAPSMSGKGSVREHVEEAIIRNGGKFCYDQAVKGYMGLTNGQADYIRGALAAGIMVGVKDWVDCGVSGPYCIENFLENCLDRDGQYYETSVGYGDHALSIYVDCAEMLYNYRTPEHPNGINLYRNPKLAKALFAASLDLDCFGHYPRFGDWGPDLSVNTSSRHYAPYSQYFTEVLYARAGDEESRRHWWAARNYVCDGDVESKRAGNKHAFLRSWLLFHSEPVTSDETAGAQLVPKPILGEKGIAVLRSGKGAKGRAALLRYGPSLNHGHLDDLNLNFYALGRELTYDLGYSLGSAHVQTGWSHRTASHSLVVVNEKNQMRQPGGGGSAHIYVDDAPVRAFEASSEASYASESVSAYRRTVALVDISPGRSYLVDIFRVHGGSRHDEMWHFCGKLAGVEGAEMGDVQESGSLAGPDIDWGRKVGAAGDLVGCADRGAYWVAPPGNGYGFLYNVRRSKSISPECRAVWEVDPDKRQSAVLHLLPESGTEVVTAQAPSILPDLPKADFAILRRKGDDLKSDFVSVLEPCEGSPSVISTARLQRESVPDADAVGVRIETAGWTDYVLSALRPVSATFRTQTGETIRFAGRFGFIRVKNGNVKRAVLAGGTELSFGSFRLTSPVDGWNAKVVEVDLDRSVVRLDKSLPREVTGAVVCINRKGYSHNSPYSIESISEDGRSLTLDGSLVMGKGHAGEARPEADDAIANVVPLPQSTTVAKQESGFFRSKLLRNDRTGKTTAIVGVEKDQRTIHVRNPKVVPRGDDFTIYDVQPGDEVYVPAILGF